MEYLPCRENLQLTGSSGVGCSKLDDDVFCMKILLAGGSGYGTPALQGRGLNAPGSSGAGCIIAATGFGAPMTLQAFRTASAEVSGVSTAAAMPTMQHHLPR